MGADDAELPRGDDGEGAPTEAFGEATVIETNS
jgi:hypothetical protein